MRRRCWNGHWAGHDGSERTLAVAEAAVDVVVGRVNLGFLQRGPGRETARVAGGPASPGQSLCWAAELT